MAYDSFKIKYLFEIYPDIDFEDELVSCQTVTELPPEPSVQATSELWGDIRGNAKINRLIQSNRFRNFDVKMVLSRNIDWYLLDYASYTTLETQDGNTYLIYDVKIEQTKVSGSLNYVITVNFKVEDDQIVNHLSSDNVLSYKTATSEAVNEIQFDVNNPSYSFNNVVFDTVEVFALFYGQFKLPITALTTAFAVDDVWYLHTDNTVYNAYMNDTTGYNYAKVISKDSDYVYFYTSTGTSPDPGFDLTIGNIILDHIPTYPEIPSSITVADEIISPVIYTFIEPRYSHISEPIAGEEAPTGTEENQQTIEKDIAKFKVWLTEEEKWKAEYLRYALFSNIEISLKNYTNILPSQAKNIITLKENNNLIDLFEYDITITYNIKAVDLTG